MDNYIIYLVVGLVIVNIAMLIVLIIKSSSKGSAEKYDEIRRSINDAITNQKIEFQAEIAGVNKSIAEQRSAILKEQLEQQVRITKTLSESVDSLQRSNEEKLEKMRQTVDEKLTRTLNERLDSSFKNVGEQLQNVYKSLGEMKQLSSGVTDLQRLLNNVKARGTWAEVQLGNILEQTMSPEQYEKNVSVRNNSERVEYAVKIPSRDDDNKFVYLPIDSKFPQEDYLRLQQASEQADKEAADACVKQLEASIKREAASISKLYIEVPVTTDFAIMFLPTEGLYAEVLRIPGLVEEIQRKNRVMICGPTTITAFLNTLQMGFRTIAIDKRASEVWKLLGAAKQQYDTFADLLIKAKRKIDEAGNVISEAEHRNSIIQKNLRNVEKLDANEAELLLNGEKLDQLI